MKWLSALVDLAAHWHMFCSSLQLKTRYGLLVGDVEEVLNHKRVLEYEEPDTQATTASEVKSKAWYYLQIHRSTTVTLT